MNLSPRSHDELLSLAAKVRLDEGAVDEGAVDEGAVVGRLPERARHDSVFLQSLRGVATHDALLHLHRQMKCRGTAAAHASHTL
jgi:hypothetical protein